MPTRNSTFHSFLLRRKLRNKYFSSSKAPKQRRTKGRTLRINVHSKLLSVPPCHLPSPPPPPPPPSTPPLQKQKKRGKPNGKKKNPSAVDFEYCLQLSYKTCREQRQVTKRASYGLACTKGMLRTWCKRTEWSCRHACYACFAVPVGLLVPTQMTTEKNMQTHV